MAIVSARIPGSLEGGRRECLPHRKHGYIALPCSKMTHHAAHKMISRKDSLPVRKKMSGMVSSSSDCGGMTSSRRRSSSHKHQHRVSLKVPQPVDVDATHVLISVGRAILARLLFIVHSMATIYHTVHIEGRDTVWGFALISLLIVFEGSYTIIMRAGDERKWFCTSVLLYIVATAPPIWLLETKMCEWRKEIFTSGSSQVQISGADDELRLQLLEQLLLVTLIIGRWMLPKGDISREQLSQILLAYLAISSDIVEFFDVFKEKVVYLNVSLQQIVLAAWTLSLVQFPFVLTVSRARKMRVAITKTYEELIMPRRRDMWQIIHDVDIWAIVLANSLQDIPFLLVRLHLMLHHGLVTYTMIFFTCKNALIIVLQTYRAFIILNDRYIHPRAPGLDMLEEPMREHTHHSSRSSKPKRRKGKREKSEDRQNLYSPRRDRNSNRREMDILEESIA